MSPQNIFSRGALTVPPSLSASKILRRSLSSVPMMVSSILVWTSFVASAGHSPAT